MGEIMHSWILTGGVGCGKSSCAQALMSRLGEKARFFSADTEAQRLLDEPATLDALRELFGPEAVAGQGVDARASRPWLRQRVFGDAEARTRLEGLLHPAVLSSLEGAREAARGGGVELFLAEVPLHYEIGGSVSADLIIVVAASRAVQVRRLMERRGLEEPVIEKMLRSQWPIEAKVERADVVIWNDGATEALEAQVLTLARQYWQA